MKNGDTVKFAQCLEPGDDTLTFTVLEMRGDRVLVEANVGMRLNPTYVYPTADMVVCAS